MYYVYVLLDSSKPGIFNYGNFTFNHEPFYVGKGKGKRIKHTLYDRSPFKYNKIKKLRENNIDIITLKVEDNLSNDYAIALEKKLIKLIGRRDLNEGTLVNTTDGGDGRINSKHSEETKLKISESKIGNSSGWKHKKETINIMSLIQSGEGNGFYGKSHSDEVKLEQSKRVSGTKHPMYSKKHKKETIDKLKIIRKKVDNTKIKKACQKFNKEVLMYDLNLKFLNKFESVKEASIKTGINESVISKCCRGDIKSPTRYFFKYSKEEHKIKNNKFLIGVNSNFYFGGKKYKLIKRNKKTCICEDASKNKVTIHERNLKYLFEKDTNDSDIIELYLFLKGLDNKFKIKNNLISNGHLNLYYLKLKNNSEIFNKKRYLSEIDGIKIFEDEWINKKDIVKSRLFNLLNKSKVIYARKCEIKEVKDNKLIKQFLNKNHIQGFLGSKVKLGLFYEKELVSIMTFGNLRKNLGQKSKKGNYELLRFCNKKYHTVVGGASKLFKYFTKKYKPHYVLSYADKRWSDGNLYHKLGFEYVHTSSPNYFYIIGNKREGRFKYRKDILVKEGFDPNMTEISIQHSRGYYRIFDEGSMKFEIEFKQNH